MNNVHIIDRDISLSHIEYAQFDLTKLFCGLLYKSKEPTLHKVARIYRIYKGKFIAEGESIDNLIHNYPRYMTLQPVILYDIASGSDSDYCVLCRYEFYQQGGMLLSKQNFEKIFGKDFYPEVIKKRDSEING